VAEAKPTRSELLDDLLERASELESAQARVADLEARIEALLGVDLDEARAQAQVWRLRAENAENLLADLRSWLQENPSVADLLPDGYRPRLYAQLKSIPAEPNLHGKEAMLFAPGMGDMLATLESGGQYE